jgi:rRNA biogenesis protein RRP5
VGKPIRVRITAVFPESRHVVASIIQASSTFVAPVAADISGVEVSNNVEGVVLEVHKDNVVLTLQPSGVRALLSLKNLANQRKLPVAQMRSAVKPGDALGGLFVVTREPEKGFVIVASRPRAKPTFEQKVPLKMDTVHVGQLVVGRSMRQHRGGTLVKLSSSITGLLHPTDASDNYESGLLFPSADSIVRAAVVAIDCEKKQLTLSTRTSYMEPDGHHVVVDPVYKSVGDLKEGKAVRGFVKSVAEHGLFVGLSRDIDARVQIKELFDEVCPHAWSYCAYANMMTIIVRQGLEAALSGQPARERPRAKVCRHPTALLLCFNICRVDVEKKQVELTFRTGELSKLKSSLTLADLCQGQKIEGRVKKIEDYGLFIQITDSKLSGLCHKSEVSLFSSIMVAVLILSLAIRQQGG